MTKDTLADTHSVQKLNNNLLFNYLSDFEDFEVKLKKVTNFLNTISLDRIGLLAKQEFLDARDQPMDDANRDAELDDEILAALDD